MSVFIKKIVFPTLIFIFIFTLILYLINDCQSAKTSVNYTLKSYKNTVALFNGEEIVEIYNNVVLNTLPEKGIQNFNSGITVATRAQAEAYLEDFDE